jgi:amino acid permease
MLSIRTSIRSSIVGYGTTLPSLQKEHGLNAFGGGLAMVSTIIGGGIVGLPYAMFLLGLVVGISLNLVICYLTFVSGILYLSL